MSRNSLARQYEPEDTTEMWKAWQGRMVDGKFLLQEYLGGSGHSAVYLTSTLTAATGESGKAAIKLIAADLDNAEQQLEAWRSVRDLTHPNLIRILDCGSGEIDGTALLYVVQEFGEENLAQIVPERPLTAEEVQGMLPPILEALKFAHDKGFVHGGVQPSNILAVGDQVKLASDVLRTGKKSARTPNAYDAPEIGAGKISKASDVWQLGMTLVEVLTQRLPVRSGPAAPVVPAAISEPFREIATRCLQIDESKRWSVSEIQDRLAGKPRPAPALVPKQPASPATPMEAQGKPSRAWAYLVGVAAIAALAFVIIPRPKQATPIAAPSAAPQVQVPTGGEAPAKIESGTSTSNGDQKPSAAADQDGVVHRQLPEVSQGARRTIHGTIQVRVKVKVDANGDVTKTKVESGRASKYFKRLAQNAANDWKFAPAAGDSSDRVWRLQFSFSRAKTDATATRVTR